ncbi:MAG: hypothetical protein RSF00_05050 [Oscillospiraceae bacterium]
MRAKKLALGAVLAAILMVAQVVLSFLPNIELCSLLIILYTLCFTPAVAVWAVAVFVILQGLLYGFGIWWFSWLYIWPVLILFAWLFRRNTSAVLWAVIAGVFGLCFGALCALPYFITGGFYAGISYWFAGIPFDIAHCVGNFVLTLVLFKPLYKCFNSIYTKEFLGVSY